MAEPGPKGTSFPETNKDKIGYLYYLQKEGSISLYQCIGYFMRMRLWSDINDPTMLARIMKADNEQEYKDIYEDMMGLMTDYIKRVSMEDASNMIFNRNMVKSKFENDPECYVRNLRECLVTEETLLRKYFNVSKIAWNSLPSPTHHDLIEEDSPQGTTCNNESENKMTLSQDDDIFMDRIKRQFNMFLQIAKIMRGSDFQMWPSKYLETYEAHANHVLKDLEEGLERLKEIKIRFLRYQAQKEVELMQEHDILGQITELFAAYDNVIKEFHRVYIYRQKLNGIIDAYMDMALIVLKHPGHTMIKGTDGKKDKKNERKDNSKGKGQKSKDTKIYSTCQSGISTTLQILSNTSTEVFQMESYSLTLVTEGGQNAGILTNFGDPKLEDSKLSFKNIAVSGHQRESPSGIRDQFLRLEYTVYVTRFDRKFELKTKSLPFHLSTSNQQSLELTGARLWYFFCNKDDMYLNCQLRELLEKDSFLQMLDQMIRTVSCRRLSATDKETLWSLAPQYKGNASEQREIIRGHDFLKTSMAASVSNKEVDEKGKKGFSFYDWHHALVYTIKNFLLKPWNEGLIYGVLTKEGVKNVLLRDAFPVGTALLRPVTSELIKEKSKDEKNTEWILIKIAVSLKVKVKRGRADGIAFATISAQDIAKNGLYGSLKSIKMTTTNGAKFLVKKVLKAGNTLVTMEELERMYPLTPRKKLKTVGDGYVSPEPSTKYLIEDGDEESDSTSAPVQDHSSALSFRSPLSHGSDVSMSDDRSVSTDTESPYSHSSVMTTGITSPSSQEHSFDDSEMSHSVDNPASAAVESHDSSSTREDGVQHEIRAVTQQPGNYDHGNSQFPFNSEFLPSTSNASTPRIEPESTDKHINFDYTDIQFFDKCADLINFIESPQNEFMDTT